MKALATVSPTAPLNSAFARFGRMAADTGQIVWVLGEGVQGCWLVGVRRRQTRWRGRGGGGGGGGTWGAVGERVAVVLEVWTDRWTDRCVNRRMDGRGVRGAGWEWHRGGRGVREGVRGGGGVWGGGGGREERAKKGLNKGVKMCRRREKRSAD